MRALAPCHSVSTNLNGSCVRAPGFGCGRGGRGLGGARRSRSRRPGRSTTLSNKRVVCLSAGVCIIIDRAPGPGYLSRSVRCRVNVAIHSSLKLPTDIHLGRGKIRSRQRVHTGVGNSLEVWRCPAPTPRTPAQRHRSMGSFNPIEVEG